MTPFVVHVCGLDLSGCDDIAAAIETAVKPLGLEVIHRGPGALAGGVMVILQRVGDTLPRALALAIPATAAASRSDFARERTRLTTRGGNDALWGIARL